MCENSGRRLQGVPMAASAASALASSSAAFLAASAFAIAVFFSSWKCQGCEDLWHSMTSWFDFGLLHQEVSGKAAHGSTLWTLDVQQVWSLKITICRISKQSCTLEINNTCWSDKSICSESFRVLIVRVSCFNLPNRQTKTWKTKRCVILHVVSLPSAFKVTHQTCMLYNYITYITDQHWQVEAMQQSWMSNCWSGINKHMSFNSYIPSYQIWYSQPQSLC